MESLMYPLQANTVPSWAVPVMALGAPALSFVVAFAFTRNLTDVHHSLLGLLYAFFATLLITDALKVSVGRPRPDFFIRCFPSGQPLYSDTGDAMCNGVPDVVTEGRKSFPSGHSSLTFSGMAYLALFLAAKLHSFVPSDGILWRLIPPCVPLAVGVAVGVTRIDDYWHFPSDVFVGSLIGITMAALAYFTHYPSLRSHKCHLPREQIRMDGLGGSAIADEQAVAMMDRGAMEGGSLVRRPLDRGSLDREADVDRHREDEQV
eukprot:TRINITY_DN21781_c0_g1_i1.p1 TRINITY_DN21781_c0_g1~~TRINITY_DN21781_c0_g1_i1.p1  ORF type:complete len:278 (+),score=-9.64 TRINITY_DN21781_c0_g1_i1:50-835(+)